MEGRALGRGEVRSTAHRFMHAQGSRPLSVIVRTLIRNAYANRQYDSRNGHPPRITKPYFTKFGYICYLYQDVLSLQCKLNAIAHMSHPTGDPNIPAFVSNAKDIVQEIEIRLDSTTLHHMTLGLLGSFDKKKSAVV